MSKKTSIRDVATSLPTVLTLARARRAYAERVTTAPAAYDASGKVQQPRERRRAPRSMSFRMWARSEFGKQPAGALSPKLATIVHGPEA